jgi:hypothetical protein
MSLTQYLEELNEACVYANECAPDISLIHAPGPFFALFCIGAVCFLVWSWNEKAIARQLKAEADYALVLAAHGVQALKCVVAGADAEAMEPTTARERRAA